MSSKGGLKTMIVPVGMDTFEEIRRDNSYYVDKTELIYELLRGTKNKVTLFT
ncbi:MAG: AAA family ATPase, partial [Clostridia bacterium]|nr:AAA family ATPase [Clostridia bacterium]